MIALLIIVSVLFIASLISAILTYKELQKSREKQKEIRKKQIDLMREITGSNDENELNSYVDLVNVNLSKLKSRIYSLARKEIENGNN